MTASKKASSTKAESIDPHMMAIRYLTNKDAKHKGGPLGLRFYQGQFWQWNGSRYKVVSKSQFRAQVTHTMSQVAGELKTPFKVTRGLVANVIQALEGSTMVMEDLDLPTWLDPQGNPKAKYLSMANGLLDIDALLRGEAVTLLKANPNWFSPVTLPYKFDPDAECPLWLNFLNEIFEGDPERISLLQEWFGYCLVANTTEQKFLIMLGEGRNGKGVVCLILTAVLGEDNVSNVTLEVFGDRFQLANTIGKLANIATEVDDLGRTSEATLKQFTAGDPMYFDRKGLPGVNVRPTARLVLSANNRPKFADRSNGLWRRILLLPFDIEIPVDKVDPFLAEKLQAELPGILNWAVKGEQRRRANHGFTESRIATDAIKDYRQESNPARVFLVDQFEAVPDATVPCLELYEGYQKWCDQTGNKPLTDTALGHEIKRHFGKAVTRKRQTRAPRHYYYDGLRLLDACEPEGPKDIEFLNGLGIKI
jgi:P4 family phage/plasmid primase-like protien